ncbi:hypothetical protein EZV62_003898 [Acer yangbiense]|uniref:F-box domain-containing protein n=1 Tax=Acer yangbiense TaxID=1000413 RepID=A0A5C7II95_9ROSI|nr:hypothetical protein EZV62_003898 [Acer yangbiense]
MNIIGLKIMDFIIHHIMSHLPAKKVAQTSILSKRWSSLWTSFPIFDFDQTYFQGLHEVWDKERFYTFMNFVDASLLRFCKLRFSVQKFRLSIGHPGIDGSYSLIDNWIGLVVENEVKTLDLNLIKHKASMLNSIFLDSLDSPPQTIELDLYVLYTLPQTIFSAKSLTTLKLCGCKLDHPSGTISFPFLKELSLDKVFVNEQMVQELIRECPLLENLVFRYCWGVKRFCVSNALKLKVMEIFTYYDEVECFKIAAPSLEECTLWFEKRMRSCVIDMTKCPSLNYFNLVGANLTDQQFHNIVSKFPLLENLYLCLCNFLTNVTFSSNRLKKLEFDNCYGLKVIDIDTPNLVSFSYHSDQIPISSINAPCPWEVGFDSGRPLDTRWHLNLKDFLGTSKQIKDLCIYVKSREWLYDELRKRDAKCCSSHSIKCWRHDLKDCKIDGFTPYGDADNADIDDSMIKLPKIPSGVLKFHLVW